MLSAGSVASSVSGKTLVGVSCRPGRLFWQGVYQLFVLIFAIACDSYNGILGLQLGWCGGHLRKMYEKNQVIKAG